MLESTGPPYTLSRCTGRVGSETSYRNTVEDRSFATNNTGRPATSANATASVSGPLRADRRSCSPASRAAHDRKFLQRDSYT